MTSPELASSPCDRPRVLVVAERLPRPDESSGSARLLAMLGQLAQMASVDLWVERDEAYGRTPLAATRVAADRQRLGDLGVRVWPTTWSSFHRAATRHVWAMVIFEFHDMAARYLPAVRDWQPDATLVIDSVDVHFARLAGGARLGAVPGWQARRVHRAELAAYRRADAVIAVSEDDARILKADPRMPPVVCVPNIVTLRTRFTAARAPEVLFVGHFRHAPNPDGLHWFVREIWPRVRQLRVDARLIVVGSYPSDDIRALDGADGIQVLGYVQDLAPCFDRATLAVAPLRFGAGMKGKVTDAMAAGLPVVTTAIGAQGLDIVSGRHAIVADDPVAFAEAVALLAGDADRAAAIGMAGQQYVAQLCGAEAVAAALRDVLALARPGSTHVASRRLGAHVRLARLAARHAVWSVARRHARWLGTPRTEVDGGMGLA